MVPETTTVDTTVGSGWLDRSGRLALIGATGVGYGATVFTIDPYRPRLLGCLVHRVTGGFCPGCGSTRAVHEALHGDLAASVAAHPFVVPMVVLLVALWVAAVGRHHGRTGRFWSFTGTSVPRAVPVALVSGLVVLTVARNALGLWLPPVVAG